MNVGRLETTEGRKINKNRQRARGSLSRKTSLTMVCKLMLPAQKALVCLSKIRFSKPQDDS